MERLGEALARIRARSESETDAPETWEPEAPAADCPICKGHGFVRKNVPVGHPEFGRAIPCTCRQAEVRDRLRRRSNLGPLASRTFETFDPDGRGPITD